MLAVRVLAVAASVLIAGAAAYAAAPAITGDGVGDVKLGKKASELRQAGLIGKLRHGCELAPDTRTAKLKPPLEGQVNFTLTTPRRADNIVVSGGAKASGVGVGYAQASGQGGLPAREVRPWNGGRVRDHPRQGPEARRRQVPVRGRRRDQEGDLDRRPVHRLLRVSGATRRRARIQHCACGMTAAAGRRRHACRAFA